MSEKLKLYYPVYPYRQYQKFGDNQACTEDNDLPLSQRKVVGKYWGVVCPIGYVELYPLMGIKGHTGEDMYGAHGVPCYYSGEEGIVDEVQTEEARGLGVGVMTQNKYNFAGGDYYAKTRYWHFMSCAVKVGDIVKKGSLLGYCDNTGFSAGDHLHFELKAVEKNPEGQYPKSYNTFQDNGYFGSIDPAPFWTGEYANRPLFARDLTVGSKGEDVVLLQEYLIRNKFMKEFPEPKGYFGLKTLEGVRQFQIKHGISPIFGYFGIKTRTQLLKVYDK